MSHRETGADLAQLLREAQASELQGTTVIHVETKDLRQLVETAMHVLSMRNHPGFSEFLECLQTDLELQTVLLDQPEEFADFHTQQAELIRMLWHLLTGVEMTAPAAEPRVERKFRLVKSDS